MKEEKSKAVLIYSLKQHLELMEQASEARGHEYDSRGHEYAIRYLQTGLLPDVDDVSEFDLLESVVEDYEATWDKFCK